MLLTAINHH